jgi:DNA-binding MarR family transcriptional regulator
MTVGLYLLSHLTVNSDMLTTSAAILLLGIGLGMVMQVLVIVVQNSVDYRDLGVATSGATLFRLVGGSLGTAVLGAIFASRLAANLSRLVPTAGAAGNPDMARRMSASLLAQLPPPVRAAYLASFTASLNTVFLVAAAMCAVGFVLTWLLPERPLRTTLAESARDTGMEVAEAFARPADEDSAAAQLYNALSTLAERDVQRQHIQRIVERAGETLSPLAAWLLVQRERTPNVAPIELGRTRGIQADRVRSALDELRQRNLIARSDAGAGDAARPALTPAGCEVLERLVAARRAHLSELAADWNSRRDTDAATHLRNAVRELVPDVRRPA